ncbi:MAG: DNA polymerase IV [Flavobacteriales bacterium]|nr:DNA polymerase IV [Flavobacteriales bacterium]MDG1781063.1 DNA polymerase IV [Flavobacteriales bacterium]MDG2246225.1 DNA polymerase IV [Flavobacteriales bacterium]
MQRKIIHVDMDAFFASVEQRDNPDLRGKPVAVGGSRSRGVVAAASYEARQFGVRSAMPSSLAARKCPNLIFVKSRFDVYKKVSQQIRAIFYEYTDLVEPLSLDEAFLDVTQNKKNFPSASLIAEEIRLRIHQELNLTASAGISVNKFLAKVASDENKPNGQFLITPDQIDDFTAALPIQKFFGIGKVTAEKLSRMGINKGDDLRRFSRPALVQIFGKSGAYYHNICRGIDNREVKPDRVRRSVGAERTFGTDLDDLNQQEIALREIAEEVSRRLKGGEYKGKTLSIKLRYADFTTFTRSRSYQSYIDDEEIIAEGAIGLLREHAREQPFRLLGVTISNLNVRDEIQKGQLTIEF